MHTSLLTLPLRRKRDLVRARQRTRQLARLLGFDLQEQAVLACAVFELACQAAQWGRASLEFRLVSQTLQVCFHSPGANLPCLEKSLPGPLPMSREDVAWMLLQVNRQTSVDIFAELRQQNQDLLRTLTDLQHAEAKLAEVTWKPGAAAAA